MESLRGFDSSGSTNTPPVPPSTHSHYVLVISFVAALGGLSGPPAQAFAGWRAQAQALLDARTALAQLAAAA